MFIANYGKYNLSTPIKLKINKKTANNIFLNI